MKKINIILFLFAPLVLSSCGGTPDFPDFPTTYEDVLPAKAEEGVTLHAFCWSFNQIKEQLPVIKESGFKNVLTMPVQTPKGGGNNWWSFYQPLSFTIAEDSSLGTKQEFLSLCQEAKSYDITIMVDVVANHLANTTDKDYEFDGTPKVNPLVEQYEPVLYRNRNSNVDGVNGITFHHNKNARGSGAETQFYQYGDLPDLNTANPYVQSRVLSFLKECIDAGVGGFRFDTAKHIESPTDPDYASDFWKNTLDVAKTYYKEKNNKDLYVYGEILGEPLNRTIACYTPFMDVTADGYSGQYLSSIIAGNHVEKLAREDFGKNAPANQLIAWVESHDSYVDASSHISLSKVAKAWGVITSRKQLGGLYLARPDDSISVGNIGNYDFENQVIASCNRFHNRFLNHDEYLSYCSDTIFVNERIDSSATKDNGAMIIDIKPDAEGKAKSVMLPHLENGNYYDTVTGNKVVVNQGKANVSFDLYGVCCLVKNKTNARPRIEISERNGTFIDDKNITVKVEKMTSGSYWFNNETNKYPLSENTIISLKGHADASNNCIVHIEASNGDFTVKRNLSFKKVSVIPGGFNIVNLASKYLTDYEFYLWSWKDNGYWNKKYTVKDGVVLVDATGLTGFLFAIFEKGYVVKNVNEWDNNVIKQSSDIKGNLLASGYFDASNF